MTHREREILQWIRENPLISQQELTQKAGITRTSVAVHITNLTRKGLIRGRGYLLNEQSYIAVVGAVNMDISGTPEKALVPGDSNPGRVCVSPGGVGRNIAENLCRMGHRVTLLTALGDDLYARQIQQSCRDMGIDISHSLTVPGALTSTYLCVNNASGEMVSAVSDMSIYAAITPEYLRGQLEVLNRAALVVLDANVPVESIAFLAQNVRVPMAADPVSTRKAEKLRPVLPKLLMMKPNRPEATLLTGVPIRSNDDLPRAAEAFLKLGLENVFISMGSEGVYYDNGSERGILPCFRTEMVNTTGCGDAFLASAVSAWVDGHNLRDMALYGLAAAALCARAESAVSPELSSRAIREMIQA